MNTPIKLKFFIPVVITAGFSTMMSQIIVLRELILIFLGNELIFGEILGIWLLGSAAGSRLFCRYIRRLKQPVKMFIAIQFLLTAILPLTIFVIRLSHQIWNITQGELLNLKIIFLLPVMVLLPICMLTGILYTLGSHIYSLITKETSAAVAKVYLYEAIGSGAASLIVSIILVKFLETFQLALLICIVNMVAAILLLLYYRERSFNFKTTAIVCAIISVTSFILLFPVVDKYSLDALWHDFERLHSETTIYGNITVTKFGDSISFYENGILMFTHPDPFYAEESVHFTLLQHPDPRKILLIGGGVGGSLRQILLHPQITHVDYIEIDPKIIELGKRFLPEDETAVLHEPRVSIRNIDGRLFVKQTRQKYDAIIINLPDPGTTLINRYYTFEFFQYLKNVLAVKGVVGFSVTSSENVIGDDMAQFLSCLYNTLGRVFEDIVLIPGDTNHFIASTDSGVLTREADVLVQRLQQRNLKTQYVREYFIPYRMSKERMDYLFHRIIQTKSTLINHDFKPIGNFLDLIVWTTYFSHIVKQAFLFLNRIGFRGILTCVFVFVLPLMLKLYRHRKLNDGIIASIAAMGFSGIAFEVIIILAFQAIYGYVYFQLALILSSFMIGLALGSYWAIYRLKYPFKIFAQFKLVQFLMSLYPLILIGILFLLHKFADHSFLIQLIFFLITVTAGFLGGFQYPLAADLYSRLNNRVEKVAGTIYSWDLIGACIGAVITSTVLIPILGIYQTALVLAALNLSIFCGLMLIRESGAG